MWTFRAHFGWELCALASTGKSEGLNAENAEVGAQSAQRREWPERPALEGGPYKAGKKRMRYQPTG